MDAEIEREKKQEYLRKEVLESNYDTNDFLAFLTSKYGEDAAEIDRYNLEELTRIIDEFKVKFSPNNEESQLPKDNDDGRSNTYTDNSKNTSHTKTETLQLINDDINYKKIMIETFEDVLEGEKMVLSEISFQDLNIVISSPERIEGGLFSRSYITYLVSTSPSNFVVRRRYSDFEWLRSILADHFPAFLIPPIPTKNFSERFNDEFLEKRMRYLQRFLNSISSNPTLSCSLFYYDFLNTKNEGDWNNKKKAHSKIKIPSKLSEMKTIDGSIFCRLSSSEEADVETLKVYESLNESSLTKLSNLFKALNNEMEAVCNRMNEISDVFEQLCVISIKSHDNKTVTDTYKMMRKIMKEWGSTFIKQRDLIDVEIREYLNYKKKELICFKENLNRVETYKYNYYKSEKRLSDRKEELFKLGQVNKFEIHSDLLNKLDQQQLIKNKDYAFKYMLSRENEIIASLKRQYGFYNSTILSEFDRVKEQNGKNHKNQFIRVSEKHTDILTDLHVMWADLLSYYSEVYHSNTSKGKYKAEKSEDDLNKAQENTSQSDT